MDLRGTSLFKVRKDFLTLLGLDDDPKLQPNKRSHTEPNSERERETFDDEFNHSII